MVVDVVAEPVHIANAPSDTLALGIPGEGKHAHLL